MKNKQKFILIWWEQQVKGLLFTIFTTLNRPKESVDLEGKPSIGLGRLAGLPTKEFKACLALTYTMTAATSSTVKENIESNHKLTRVVSTKLSIEDDDFLQQLTTLEYQDGRITSKSDLIRMFVTLSLSSIRKEFPSLLTQKTKPS